MNSLLADYAPGVNQGYARVVPSNAEPFVTYAVIIDGARPGERTGDASLISNSPLLVDFGGRRTPLADPVKECRSSNDERNPKSECRTQGVEVRHSRESGNPAGLPPRLTIRRGDVPCAGATAKSDVGLFHRQVHTAEQILPAWIGMKAVEGGIYLQKAQRPLFNHPEQQPEGFILVAEGSVSSRYVHQG